MSVLSPMNVESVLSADDPVRRLRDAVAWDLSHGRTRDEVFELLDQARRSYRDRGDEEREDIIEAVMNLLVGFAPEHARL
jgi:hypothetical protein